MTELYEVAFLSITATEVIRYKDAICVAWGDMTSYVDLFGYSIPFFIIECVDSIIFFSRKRVLPISVLDKRLDDAFTKVTVSN